MNTFLKKPYELSIWEDRTGIVDNQFIVTQDTECKIGKTYYFYPNNDQTNPIEQFYDTQFQTGVIYYELEPAKQYFEEVKIAVIGSDTMDIPSRASNVNLIENINGSAQCTFDMYTHYYDDEIGDFVANPFYSLLVNERKVKLHYNNKWYDFIVKNHDETSVEYKYTITCSDMFVNELSKNGYAIEFSSELDNNSGTIIDLAEIVVENTDWTIDAVNSDLIKQKVDEALYKVKILETFEATNDNITIGQRQFNVGEYIYVYYSTYLDTPKYFQFIFVPSPESYVVDDDGIINNDNCTWYVNNFNYDYIDIGEISLEYRGNRYVRSPKTIYDSNSQQYVTLYSLDGQEYYGYEEKRYATTDLVKNVISNSVDFKTTSTWSGVNGALINNVTYPFYNPANIDNTTIGDLLSAKSYLKIQLNGGKIKNNSFTNNIANIFEVDENGDYINISPSTPYALKFKGMVLNGDTISELTNLQLTLVDNNNNKLLELDSSDGVQTSIEYEVTNDITPKNNKEYWVKNDDGEWVRASASDWDNNKVIYEKIIYYIVIGETLNIITPEDAKSNNLNIYLNSTQSEFYLQNIQLFPILYNDQGQIIFPGTVPEADHITYYHFYLKDNYSPEELITYASEDFPFIKQYNDNYVAIRSLETSKSNRFNLLQDLCETFECWLKLDVKHDENTGKIWLDSNGKPQKLISFKEFIGEDNYAGFKYGINLNSIERTVNSDQIVTKLIVEDNSNEVAEYGMCSIAAASENPYKNNFILNFDYYINQGILDKTDLYNDLYIKNDFTGSIGYLTEYAHIGKQLDKLNEEQLSLQEKIVQLNASVQASFTAYTEAEDLYNTAYNEFLTYFPNYTPEEFIETIVSNIPEAQRKLATEIARQNYLYKSQLNIYNINYDNLTQLEQRLEEVKEETEILTNQLVELDIRFYNKYALYIQEGTWTSEDYYDNNLYYLDALGVSNTSKNPEVSYTINVAEVSELEDLNLYQFKIGDKTFVEDTEFFGYITNTGDGHITKTPKRQPIVISEIQMNLDDPSQNTITVQNYKTQFEDLFNKISATIQSVEYKTGEFQRAANAVVPGGSLNTSVLENSLFNNELIIKNAGDQSVIIDHNGITVTNLSHANEQLRILGGGILLSSDGGTNWTTGIGANGLNANNMTLGSLNASRVNIYSGSYPVFKWDDTGITAYAFTKDDDGVLNAINFNKFVRLDQFGLYGYKGNSIFEPQTATDIINNEGSRFGFIWTSSNDTNADTYFFLKTNHDDGGMVKISADDDIQVFNNEVERIKIGLLNNDVYGIDIKNAEGESTFITGSDGNIWLQNTLSVGDGNNSLVNIGYDPIAVRSGTEYHEVLHAGKSSSTENSKFIVYEDGYIIAKAGQIGNLTIESIEEKIKNITLDCTTGHVINTNLEDTNRSPRVVKFKIILNDYTDAEISHYDWYINNVIQSAHTKEFSCQSSILNFVDDSNTVRADVHFTDASKASLILTYDLTLVRLDIDAEASNYVVNTNISELNLEDSRLENDSFVQLKLGALYELSYPIYQYNEDLATYEIDTNIDNQTKLNVYLLNDTNVPIYKKLNTVIYDRDIRPQLMKICFIKQTEGGEEYQPIGYENYHLRFTYAHYNTLKETSSTDTTSLIDEQVIFLDSEAYNEQLSYVSAGNRIKSFLPNTFLINEDYTLISVDLNKILDIEIDVKDNVDLLNYYGGKCAYLIQKYDTTSFTIDAGTLIHPESFDEKEIYYQAKTISGQTTYQRVNITAATFSTNYYIYNRLASNTIDVKISTNNNMSQEALILDPLIDLVDNAYIDIKSSGLNIRNGYFTMQDDEDNYTLWADNAGNLSVTGTINATHGHIGGNEYVQAGQITKSEFLDESENSYTYYVYHNNNYIQCYKANDINNFTLTIEPYDAQLNYSSEEYTYNEWRPTSGNIQQSYIDQVKIGLYKVIDMGSNPTNPSADYGYKTTQIIWKDWEPLLNYYYLDANNNFILITDEDINNETSYEQFLYNTWIYNNFNFDYYIEPYHNYYNYYILQNNNYQRWIYTNQSEYIDKVKTGLYRTTGTGTEESEKEKITWLEWNPIELYYKRNNNNLFELINIVNTNDYIEKLKNDWLYINISFNNEEVYFTRNINQGIDITSTGLSINNSNGQIDLTSEGLIIKTNNDGSPFQIWGEDTSNPLLNVEKIDGITQLSVTGNIKATSGYLENIHIGNREEDTLIIENGSIKSTNNKLIINNQGHIEANDISLGTNAKIGNYLAVGNAKIYNPTDINNRLFIDAGAIKIYDTGKANFGNINIDGNNSIISAEDSWSLTPEWATFKNAKIQGIIETSVYSQSETQLMGGNILFKSSAVIDTIDIVENDTITFDIKIENEDENIFLKGNKVTIIKNNEATQGVVNVYKIDNINGKRLTIKPLISNQKLINVEKNDMLILLDNSVNNEDYANLNDWVIGINSTQNTNGLGIYKNSITFNSIDYIDNLFKLNPQIVLGDLSQIKNVKSNAVGLFAKNVFLTGQLTTKAPTTTEPTYAGINTNSSVQFNKDIPNVDIQDRSNIVFWGGAIDNSASNIQKAPFQVTEKGTIYANNGLFEGVVIARSILSSTVIQTPWIDGTGNNPALRITNTATNDPNKISGGILFQHGSYGDNENDLKDIFEVNSIIGGNQNIYSDIHLYNHIYNNNNYIKKEIFGIETDNNDHFILRINDCLELWNNELYLLDTPLIFGAKSIKDNTNSKFWILNADDNNFIITNNGINSNLNTLHFTNTDALINLNLDVKNNTTLENNLYIKNKNATINYGSHSIKPHKIQIIENNTTKYKYDGYDLFIVE